jgi:quercetin dioxygenase-like cupin family protein
MTERDVKLEDVTGVESLLAELALTEEPLRPSEELRARILDSLDPRTRLEGFAVRVAAFLDLGLERTREILALAADVTAAPWEDDRVAGVRLLHFAGGPRVATADCGLVHVAPGVVYPRHLHRGDEWAFVLSGRGEEDTGRVWEPGDVIRNPAGSSHSFRAISEEPFLFVVVVHEGIRFARG